MSKPMKDINSAWKVETKKQLDEIWGSRYCFSLSNLEFLCILANKLY